MAMLRKPYHKKKASANNLSLPALIKAMDFKHKDLATALSITEGTFTNKLHGWRTFTDAEILALSKLLEVNPRVIRYAMPARRY